MENQTTQTPQVMAQQAQAQMILEIVKQAGLDANNVENHKAAAEVLQNVGQLQEPAREKERNALMREFGLQPDEFAAAMKGYENKAKAVGKQAEDISSQEEALAGKFKKRGLIQLGLALVAAVGSAYFSYQKLKTSGGKLKKFGGTALATIAGGAIINAIAGQFTTKPVRKEAEALNEQKGQLADKFQQIEADAQKHQYDTFRNLAAGMLKERVQKQTAAPAVKLPVAAPVVEKTAVETPKVEAEKKSFTEGLADKAHAVTDKILRKTSSAISPEAIEAHKAEAANSSIQVG